MSKDSRRRVGIMGGTFDPIHIGHLILGENAYQQFGLDCVLFMPSGNPPHLTQITILLWEQNPFLHLRVGKSRRESATYVQF